MKGIAVCYKWVRDDADIRVLPSRALDMERAQYKISEYDKNTIEAGVRFKVEANATALIGLTCGAQCTASAKEALSRGLDAVHCCPLLPADADNGVTAKALAELLGQVGDVEVVLCSEGSGDEYAQQTAPRLAALLNWNCVTYAEKITPCGDKLRIVRALDDCMETVEVPLPVVISVVPSISDAPIPSVKAILGAKKKPAEERACPAAAALKPHLEEVSTLAPEANRKCQRLNTDGVSLQEAAANLQKLLRADGVL